MARNVLPMGTLSSARQAHFFHGQSATRFYAYETATNKAIMKKQSKKRAKTHPGLPRSPLTRRESERMAQMQPDLETRPKKKSRSKSKAIREAQERLREEEVGGLSRSPGNSLLYGHAEKMIRPIEVLNARVGKIQIGSKIHENRCFMSVDLDMDGSVQSAMFAVSIIIDGLVLRRVDALIEVCGATSLRDCEGAYVRVVRPEASGSGMLIAGLMHIVDATKFVSTGVYEDPQDLLFSEFIDPLKLKLVGVRDNKIVTI